MPEQERPALAVREPDQPIIEGGRYLDPVDPGGFDERLAV